jgi:oxygen-independent coproporphyrinogen-3 oxidase
VLPDGEPAPVDGALPAAALSGAGDRDFGIYVHVPYCATRCGYCDFNTYTAAELTGQAGGVASASTYADTAIAELRLARAVLGGAARPATTVFFGGGTPTLLPAADLGRILAAIRAEFGLTADAEVTTEANPDLVDAAYLAALREAGFTRISFGMQSARSHVLAVLDRTHTPGRPEQCVADARSAGFAHVNVDLIYGTPGETDADWRASLDAVTATGADHVSAYALIVEEGTGLARRIRRGELAPVDDDVLADRYVMAEDALAAAGFGWYEVSNWARSADAECRHNLLYWRGGDWWGIGPGAHSHVGGVRWWNVKHPSAYADRLAAGVSPAHGREVLTAENRRAERIMLGLRLAAGLPLDELSEAGRAAARTAATDGLLRTDALSAGRTVLTRRGRLLADAVVRALL